MDTCAKNAAKRQRSIPTGWSMAPAKTTEDQDMGQTIEKESPKTSCTVIFSDSSRPLLLLSGVALPIQKAASAHRAFILATWVRSFQPALRKWLGNLGLLDQEVKLAEQLWDRSKVVVSEDDDFTVHAWICGKPGQVDYVYVPPELRGKGIARALISHVCGPTFEHGRPWPFKGGVKGGTYNPYILGCGYAKSEGSNESA